MISLLKIGEGSYSYFTGSLPRLSILRLIINSYCTNFTVSTTVTFPAVTAMPAFISLL